MESQIKVLELLFLDRDEVLNGIPEPVVSQKTEKSCLLADVEDGLVLSDPEAELPESVLDENEETPLPKALQLQLSSLPRSSELFESYLSPGFRENTLRTRDVFGFDINLALPDYENKIFVGEQSSKNLAPAIKESVLK